LRAYIKPESKAALGLMYTQHHTLGTFDVSLDPYTTMAPGTVLNNDGLLLENLGIGRAAARRHAEDTALAMATYAQQDEDRWIHKLASISRELGNTISPNLPKELLFSPADNRDYSRALFANAPCLPHTHQ
jgi:hypothetical protein